MTDSRASAPRDSKAAGIGNSIASSAIFAPSSCWVLFTYIAEVSLDTTITKRERKRDKNVVLRRQSLTRDISATFFHDFFISVKYQKRGEYS